MTLDELLNVLTRMKSVVGGSVRVAVAPSIFYSDRPTFALYATLQNVQYYVPEGETFVSKIEPDVVVIS